MDMFEEARTISGMRAMCALTQSEIAQKMGVSQSYVANKIRLLHFSDKIQKRILSAGLSERHARALLRLKSDALVCEAIEKIEKMRLSVSETEALVDEMTLSYRVSKLCSVSTTDGINAFEDIITESIKNLAAHGVKVTKSRDFYKNKLLLTLSIEK